MTTEKYLIYHELIRPANFSNAVEKEYLKGIRALEKFTPQDFFISDVEKSVLSIEVILGIPDELQKLLDFGSRPTWYHYIKAEITLEFNEIEFAPFTEEEHVISVSHRHSSSAFQIGKIIKRYREFLMILNLCRIGAYHFSAAILFAPYGVQRRIPSNMFYSFELLEFSLKHKWPTFRNLGLVNTWKWFFSKVNSGELDNISASPLTRAFHAYSYLYEGSAEINKLFWTMLGLEAIYVRGKEGIGEQLKVKAQIFLGNITEFKNMLTKIYSFRSAFVHGTKDFPSFYHIHDADEKFVAHSNELHNVLMTAQSMLIATLQKMAFENRSELEFKYILIEPAKPRIIKKKKSPTKTN